MQFKVGNILNEYYTREGVDMSPVWVSSYIIVRAPLPEASFPSRRGIGMPDGIEGLCLFDSTADTPGVGAVIGISTDIRKPRQFIDVKIEWEEVEIAV